MLRRTLILFALMLVSLWMPTSRAEAQTPTNSYSYVEVGLSTVYGLNDAGAVVGTVDHTAGSHAVLAQNGVWTYLGSLGGTYSIATDINNANQVVGYSTLVGEIDTHAFLWSQTSGLQDLGTLGGGGSWAQAINDVGQVVGTSQNAAGNSRAFLWKNGLMVDLGVPLGYVSSSANDINASGQVVGEVADNMGLRRAFRWTPTVPNGTTGTMVLLESAPDGTAYSINTFGEVAGMINWYPTLWNSAGALTFLPLLNTNYGLARGINDSRTIVGFYDDSDSGRAFVWDSLHGTRDLSLLAHQAMSFAFYDASRINASGQILTTVWEFSTFLLTPSPLPARPWNLGASAGGVGVNLSWNASSGATSYKVRRSVASGGPYTLLATVPGTTYTDSTAANNTPSYYVVSAANTYGESANSDETFFISPPAPPTSLTATVGKRKVTLKWTQSVSAGVTQNRIYRSTTNGSGYSLRATISANTSFIDTSVASRTTYYYVVTAMRSGGQESVYSNQVSAKPH